MNNEKAREEISQHEWHSEDLRRAAELVEWNTNHAYAAVRQIIYADQYERADHLRALIEAAEALKSQHELSLAKYSAELEAVEAALGGAS